MGMRIIYDIDPGVNDIKIMDWLTSGGWCDTIEVRPSVSMEKVKELRDKGFNVSLHMPAHSLSRRRQYCSSNMEKPDVHTIINKHIAAARGDISQVEWTMLIEEDSAGVAFPQELIKASPKSHKEAYGLFMERLEEAIKEANNYRGIHKTGLLGFASSAHPYAKTGFDTIILERTNDDVDDLQTGLAFCRGAAAQYGCEWGIDLSFWWGVIYGGVFDAPVSYHKRSLYAAFFSGAKALLLEGGSAFMSADRSKLYRVGKMMDEFGEFQSKYEPGIPDVPVGIIIPEDSGWMTQPYWRPGKQGWNYARLPYRHGEKGIDGFMGLAFPGSVYAMDPFPLGKYESDAIPPSPFALSYISPEYCPVEEKVFSAQAPVPFGKFENREEAKKWMEENDIDSSCFRPMGNSRWGDIFDVFTETVFFDTLSKYGVLILLGPIKLSTELKTYLRQYMTNGGMVVASLGTIGLEDLDLTGLSFEPVLYTGNAWQWEEEDFAHEAFRFCPIAQHKRDGFDVLAKDYLGNPLILKKSIGKGSLHLCAIPWFEGGHTDIARLSERLFDSVIAKVQPVKVEGLPIQWLSTTQGREKTVVLINNSYCNWEGRVYVENSFSSYSQCLELFSQEEISYEQNEGVYKVNFEISSYDLKAIRFIDNEERK